MKARCPNPAAVHVAVLAAGAGTRMKSALPKVLHTIAGKPMLSHVLDTAERLAPAAIHVVHGNGGDAVRAALGDRPGVRWVTQARQLGTGHALAQALRGIPDQARVLVLYGDVPLIRAETLAALLAAAGRGVALLTARLDDPVGYGRVLRDRSRRVRGIVEERDATTAQRKIREVNTGVLTAPAERLRNWLDKLDNHNASGEYYLTDIVALAVRARQRVVAVAAVDAEEVLGVNDRAQLARAERRFQRRQAESLMREGLGLVDPTRFDLRGRLSFGRDVFIDVGCVLEGEVELADGVQIGPHCVLRNVKLGAGTEVAAHTVLESATVAADCRIGPFARLRPGAVLAERVHVGNFVEIKNASLGEGAKANHLAYVGDATVGARVNVGAGVITCNYDGADKHRTIIGDDAFIGSDSQLIAPVTVGPRAYIAAGSTITCDAPADALTISRAREQKSYPGWKRPKKIR